MVWTIRKLNKMADRSRTRTPFENGTAINHLKSEQVQYSSPIVPIKFVIQNPAVKVLSYKQGRNLVESYPWVLSPARRSVLIIQVYPVLHDTNFIDQSNQMIKATNVIFMKFIWNQTSLT